MLQTRCISHISQSRVCGNIHQSLVSLIIRCSPSQYQSLLLFLQLTADYHDTLVLDIVPRSGKAMNDYSEVNFI